IRWTYTGTTVNNVNTYYSTDAGANWTLINSSIPNTNNGTYIWPSVPIVTTSTAMVKVQDSEFSLVSGLSPVFNIVGNLKLTTPDGAENWEVGTAKTITWSQYAVNLVNISYSLNNGSNWTSLTSNYNATPPNYQWNILNDTQASNLARIKVDDASNPIVVNDTSNNPFSVIPVFDVTQPENGNIVVAEESYYINWTSKGTGVSNVTLEYSTDNGGNWSYVRNVSDYTVPNTGTYFWNPVPGDKLSEQSKMRVSYPQNVNASNMSTGVFYLRGKLSVTRPDGGEVWNLSALENINWTKKGNIGALNIYYSPDNGTNWTTLATSVNASSLLWVWNITDTSTTTTQGRIKVADSSLVDFVYDTSNSTFELRGKINVTAPSASGTVLTYNGGTSSYNITWTRFGPIPKVNIAYSTDGGSTYPNTIVTNLSAAASPYNWTIPDKIGYNLSIKVSDVDNPSVNDTSDNLFAIKGSELVLQPNGAESWLKGTTQQIQWRPTGS
ncbi:MAG: hypothetical protein Q7J79_11125, partial [Gemmatimonadales bacterium]|nr:hypothetical protein [Gemmatimonadales bacterium]